MRDSIAFLRSLAFTIIFYPLSALLVIIAFVIMPFSIGAVQSLARIWSRFHYLCARILLGIRVEVEGQWASEPVFYAFKHEAMFETLELPRLLGIPAIVAKRELADIPLWGRIARRYGMIFIERKGGAATLRKMMRSMREMVEAERALVIFPEGTRMTHGEQRKLQSGFAGLYKMAGLPVVPVAVNSGRLIRKGRFVKYPGTIRYVIGAPIPPGLERGELEARTLAAINFLNHDSAQS